MRLPEIPKPLVVILGPTAVGKTETSISLAERLGGEIVSADSRLFYRGMDIGTAKPSNEEKQCVPHHLIDIANPDETWSLTIFQQAAQSAIDKIYEHRRLPILVGGTGQYIRAVIEGWEAPPLHPNPQLRDAITSWGQSIGARELHRRLMLIDPVAAGKIESNNLRRTVRALEVIFHSGRRFSYQRGKKPCPFSRLLIGLRRPRPVLYQRIDERIESMFAMGLLDEVRVLLEKGYSPELPAFSAIGYREAIACLRGELTEAEAIMLMKRATHQFVRRQANWFKESDPAIHWVEAGVTAVDEIINLACEPMNWIMPGW